MMYTSDDISLDKVRDNVKESISLLNNILLNDDSEYRRDYLEQLTEANSLLLKVRQLLKPNLPG